MLFLSLEKDDIETEDSVEMFDMSEEVDNDVRLLAKFADWLFIFKLSFRRFSFELLTEL
jgi:hypothetical protein